jgi:hypothetical protein
VNVPQATGGASDVVEARVKRRVLTATGVESKSRMNTDAQVVML